MEATLVTVEPEKYKFLMISLLLHDAIVVAVMLWYIIYGGIRANAALVLHFYAVYFAADDPISFNSVEAPS